MWPPLPVRERKYTVVPPAPRVRYGSSLSQVAMFGRKLPTKRLRRPERLPEVVLREVYTWLVDEVGLRPWIAGSLAVTQTLTGYLYGVSATDAGTFVSTSLLLMVVALLACYIPAKRATKVSPLIALRYE